MEIWSLLVEVCNERQLRGVKEKKSSAVCSFKGYNQRKFVVLKGYQRGLDNCRAALGEAESLLYELQGQILEVPHLSRRWHGGTVMNR